MPQGKGVRCYGFLSSDGNWAHCTREEKAGTLPVENESGTYAHSLRGDCKCGVRHDSALRLAPSAPDQTSVTHWYPIRDAEGVLVAKHKRVDFPNGDKTCVWYGPDGSIGLKGRPCDTLPLYGTHLLRTHPPESVILVEGEKAADALVSAEKLAVGTVTGAGGTPTVDVLKPLAGRTVYLWPDNDQPGLAHMQRIASRLLEIVGRLYWVNWTGAPEGGDAADFIKRCGSNGALDRLLVSAAPYEYPTADAQMPISTGLLTTNARDLMAMEFDPIHWIVVNLIAPGLTLLAGRPKAGKSWICVALALAVASGGRAFGGIQVKGGSVLYLALEDTKRRLQERMRKILVDGIIPESLEFVTMDSDFPRLHDGGVELIDAWLDAHPDARLIIIDTLKKVRAPHRVNGSVYDQDYDSVDELLKLAARRGVGVVVVHHTRKSTADDAIAEVSGSYGLTANVDTILVFRRPQGAAEATLVVTGRDVEDQELALKWDPDLFQWVITGDAASARISQERREVLHVLRLTPEGLTPKAVAEAIGKPRVAIRYLLRQMHQAGQVRQLDGGAYVAVDSEQKVAQITSSQSSQPSQAPLTNVENTEFTAIL